jgi:hypothetical protein
MHIYLPGDVPVGGAYPSILAIGDSWFWYPKNNILMAIAQHPALKDPFRNIQILGYNGTPISQYVDRNDIRGRYAKEFQHQLEPLNAQYYSAVMISGGGNDAVDYRLALRDKCAGITDPDKCMDAEGLAGLLDDVTGALEIMLYEIARSFASRPRPVDVFLHGYDYPVPDGRGFSLAGLRVAGPWLKPALDAAGVDADAQLRKAICKNLIDALNVAIAKFDNHAQAVHYINNRGVLSSAAADYTQDWDNELHPTIAGFKREVDERWIPVLAREGYATA